jgi:mannose-6-phosphate isomerase-like protein (cupin superfamily)
MTGKVNLSEKLGLFDDLFSPKIIARYNGNKIFLGKMKGEFVWHSHPDTDDFFLVVEGSLTIDLPDRSVELAAGELFVVPAGIEHRPRSAEGASVLLIEPEGTPNTGDATTATPDVEL